MNEAASADECRRSNYCKPAEAGALDGVASGRGPLSIWPRICVIAVVVRASMAGMPYKLAFMTVGILREPVGHEQVQGFIDRVPSVYVAADASEGFQGRSIRDMNTYLHSWGEVKLPACYPQPMPNERIAVTLSRWTDLESVAAFSYHGAHAEALTKRREWFDKLKLPPSVAWWVEAEHAIDWAEGCERLDRLHRDGPTAFAFNFAKPFDCEGKPCLVNRELVKAKAARNEQARDSCPPVHGA